MELATRLTPESAEFHLDLSDLYRELGMLKEEKSEIQHALRIDPKSTTAHYKLAALAKKEGDTQTSRTEFDKVRQIRETVIHELGHYFGLSDRDMHF